MSLYRKVYGASENIFWQLVGSGEIEIKKSPVMSSGLSPIQTVTMTEMAYCILVGRQNLSQPGQDSMMEIGLDET